VSLTGPEAFSVAAGARVTLSAVAEDADGAIASVTFYVNQKLLVADSSAPYSTVWKAPKQGTYSIVAVAKDAGELTTTSAPVAITVQLRSGR